LACLGQIGHADLQQTLGHLIQFLFLRAERILRELFNGHAVGLEVVSKRLGPDVGAALRQIRRRIQGDLDFCGLANPGQGQHTKKSKTNTEHFSHDNAPPQVISPPKRGL
jgi:hypothetical protein